MGSHNTKVETSCLRQDFSNFQMLICHPDLVVYFYYPSTRGLRQEDFLIEANMS